MNTLIPLPKRWRLSLLCIPALLSAAETVVDATKTTETVHELEDYVVSETIPEDDKILPTTRPFNSVYGNNLNILDTPRNVTIISRAQLDDISIKDTRDFTKLTSSSYTGSNFGAPTTPSLRGQTADTLINGMRKGLSNNGNGLPLNFNAVESVNILKGPPSVMVGVSQYVGGYVDYITKKPTFDNSGYFELRVDSEGLRVGQLDQNLKLSDELAMRFSITGENTDNYYWDNYYRKTTALYGALTWLPTDNYQLEVNGEFFNANYTENWGINRPTNDLINNRSYVTGQGSVGVYSFGTVVPQTSEQIARTKRLHGEGDDSNGKYLSLQAIQTIQTESNLEIANNTLFQYRDRDTYSSYQYSEVLRDNFRIENRTEFRSSFDLLNIVNQINTGLSLSYQDVWAVNDFYNEPANAWDLYNQSYSEIGLTDADILGGGFNNSFPILGEDPRGKLSFRPGSTAANYDLDQDGIPDVIGNGDSNDSQTASLGLFIQNVSELNERLSLLLGGRLDYVYVTSADPMFASMMHYLRQQNPGTDYSGVQQAKDSLGDFVPNFNSGIVFKLNQNHRLYANYNYSESIPIGLGGGVPLDPATGKLDSDAFDVASQLVEAGYKSSLLENRIFYSANVFYQTRNEPQSQGPDNRITAKGFETELSFQAASRTYFTFGYSYIDSVSENGAVSTPNPIDPNAPVHVYGTFPTFDGYDARTPGVPQNIINSLVSYALSEQLTTTLGLVVTSPIKTGYTVPAAFTSDGQNWTAAEIPWQYSIDWGIRYDTRHWGLGVKILNLTDEENWGVANSIYGNDSIYAELPRRIELTSVLKW